MGTENGEIWRSSTCLMIVVRNVILTLSLGDQDDVGPWHCDLNVVLMMQSGDWSSAIRKEHISTSLTCGYVLS